MFVVVKIKKICNQSFEIVLWLIEIVSVLNCENSVRLLAMKINSKIDFHVINFSAMFCTLFVERIYLDRMWWIHFSLYNTQWVIVRCHVCQMLNSQTDLVQDSTHSLNIYLEVHVGSFL